MPSAATARPIQLKASPTTASPALAPGSPLSSARSTSTVNSWAGSRWTRMLGSSRRSCSYAVRTQVSRSPFPSCRVVQPGRGLAVHCHCVPGRPPGKSSSTAGAATGWAGVTGLVYRGTGSPPSPMTGQPSASQRIGWRWTTRPYAPRAWKWRNQSSPSEVCTQPP
ncbi:hypothetical protein ASD29_31390 [Streptomyces sp. Root1295]|nr:hypothetical protein ASD29_31390 [Streptomyces sp. Root1295]